VIESSHVTLAVAQEVLRLKPSVGIVFRKALHDTQVGSMRVPKDTVVMLRLVSAIRASGNGGGTFDPCQWLQGPDSACAENDGRGNFVWGGGARRCLGEHLALVELMVTLAVLAREVQEIRMSDEEAALPFTSVLGHPTGLPVTLIPRDRASVKMGP
jgi:cytochrome P450